MDPHAAGPSVREVIWPAVNFTVYAGGLWYLLRGPVKEFFRSRAQQLREGLEAGARARREAEALRAEIARARAELPATRARLQQEMRATAEAQRDRLLEQARATAERIRRDAETLAGQEAAAARWTLRQQVAGEALRDATALVRSAVQPADQSRFVRDFVASGAASGASSGAAR